MDPITIILGLVSVGSAAVSFFKQKDENAQLQAAANADVEKAQKDLLIDRLNKNAQYIADKDKTETDVLASKANLAQTAALRANLDKRIFALIAVMAMGGILIISLRTKQ